MSASMRETVVLPLVPATTTVPWGSRLAILSSSRGSIRSATRPGAAVPPPRPRPRIAAPVALAAASAAINRASRVGELGAISQDDGDHLEPLEDDQRDDRHDLRVPLGRVRRRIADATDNQAARHTGRAQGWAIGRQHQLAWLGVAVAIEVAQLQAAAVLPLTKDDAIAATLEPRSDALGDVDDEHDAGRLLPDLGHLTDVVGSLGDDRHPDLDSVLRSLVDGQEFLLVGRVGSLDSRLEHFPGWPVLLQLGLEAELLDLAHRCLELRDLGGKLVALRLHGGKLAFHCDVAAPPRIPDL